MSSVYFRCIRFAFAISGLLLLYPEYFCCIRSALLCPGCFCCIRSALLYPVCFCCIRSALWYPVCFAVSGLLLLYSVCFCCIWSALLYTICFAVSGLPFLLLNISSYPYLDGMAQQIGSFARQASRFTVKLAMFYKTHETIYRFVIMFLEFLELGKQKLKVCCWPRKVLLDFINMKFNFFWIPLHISVIGREFCINAMVCVEYRHHVIMDISRDVAFSFLY